MSTQKNRKGNHSGSFRVRLRDAHRAAQSAQKERDTALKSIKLLKERIVELERQNAELERKYAGLKAKDSERLYEDILKRR